MPTNNILRRNQVLNVARYRLFESLRDPVPVGVRIVRALDRRFGLVKNYRRKLELGLIERPHYGYCMLHAALLGQKLGHRRISAIEFGVAGGNGLVALERHAAAVEAETGVGVEIYGFDTGTGMPPPKDYRDMPYLWQAGYFQMDVPKLKGRLERATLILGSLELTLPSFVGTYHPPPIGFVIFDLDYYSSTKIALRILECEVGFLIPRVVCYLDDIVGDIDYACNEFTGELLAVNEFNAAHDRVKIAPVKGLRHWGKRIPQLWHEQIYVAHIFDHPDYAKPIQGPHHLPLDEA